MNITATFTKDNLKNAWLQALPVVFGYIPIGFAYGILAREAGLSIFNTLAMSILVYAGSAQLISVGLFAAAISPISIIITTFIINLRHLLLSATLAPYLQQWKCKHLALFAFELTDETFALHSVRFPRIGAVPGEGITTNLIAQFSWITGTLLGVVAGDMIRDVNRLGLDYSLVAMFIALLVYQLKDWRFGMVAIVAGGLSVCLFLIGLTQWNVILATILASIIGVLIDKWNNPSSS